jgi:hypothetical protein
LVPVEMLPGTLDFNVLGVLSDVYGYGYPGCIVRSLAFRPPLAELFVSGFLHFALFFRVVIDAGRLKSIQ